MSERSDTPRTDAAISVAYAECGMKPNTPYGQEEWAGYFEEASQRLEELARQLERECEALRRDAERYRWLRDEYTSKPFDERTALRGDTLDEAIDKAIGETKG
jgi:cell division septum initiation protein DivIVA